MVLWFKVPEPPSATRRGGYAPGRAVRSSSQHHPGVTVQGAGPSSGSLNPGEPGPGPSPANRGSESGRGRAALPDLHPPMPVAGLAAASGCRHGDVGHLRVIAGPGLAGSASARALGTPHGTPWGNEPFPPVPPFARPRRFQAGAGPQRDLQLPHVRQPAGKPAGAKLGGGGCCTKRPPSQARPGSQAAPGLAGRRGPGSQGPPSMVIASGRL